MIFLAAYRPKEPRQASARDRRPRYSRAQPVRGLHRNQPDLSSRAGSDHSNEPWRQDSLWKCAVKGCGHPGTNTFLALEKHFMRWHQPQRVEYVCPFGGYRCPLQPVRLITQSRPWKDAIPSDIIVWERASTKLHYVVDDNPEMMDPGNLPKFPRDPRSGAPLCDWPFFLENAGPRWTTESMRVGWVPLTVRGGLPQNPPNPGDRMNQYTKSHPRSLLPEDQLAHGCGT